MPPGSLSLAAHSIVVGCATTDTTPDRPVAEDTTAEGRANNRRVEIVVAKNDIRAN
jgi:hypothetical protein